MDDLNNNENNQNNQAGYYPNNSQDPYSANSGFGPVNPYMNNQDGSSFNPYGMADSNSMPQNPYQNSGEFNPYSLYNSTYPGAENNQNTVQTSDNSQDLNYAQNPNTTVENDNGTFSPFDLSNESSAVPEQSTQMQDNQFNQVDASNNQAQTEPMHENQIPQEPVQENQIPQEPIQGNATSYDPAQENIQQQFVQNQGQIRNPILSQGLPTDNGMNNYSQNGSFSNNIDSYNTQPSQDYSFNGSDYTMEFVKAWMGNLYEKAHSKKFNWPAAIFGGIYFLYRKMYLTGILFIIFSSILNFLMLFLSVKVGVGLMALLPVIDIVLLLVYGFGFYPMYRNFVRGKLNKYKQTITDNSQLVQTASSKGGTSPLAVILCCIVVPIITSIVFTLFATVGIFNIFKKISGNINTPSNIISDNSIIEDNTDMKSYTFLNQYTIDYDSLTWFFNQSDSSLTKGDYKLTYSGQSIPDLKSSFNVDSTTPAGRSSLLSTLMSSLQAQAASMNLTVDVGTSNFVLGVKNYYAYIDVASDNTLTRYYIILVPEDDILFQFTLETNDTSIDYATNIEIVNMLTNISTESSNEEADDNTISNDTLISNDVSDILSNTPVNEVISTHNTISNTNSLSDMLN